MSHRALSGTDELGKRSLPAGAWVSPITHHMPPGGEGEQGKRGISEGAPAP